MAIYFVKYSAGVDTYKVYNFISTPFQSIFLHWFLSYHITYY